MLFAVISLLRTTKIKKTRFSCLFTLLCVGCAYGAAHTGLIMGNEDITFCLEKADGFIESFSAVIACGVFSMIAAGGAWFVLLLAIGALFLLLSRAKNQSWIDGDSHKDPESSARNKKLIIE